MIESSLIELPAVDDFPVIKISYIWRTKSLIELLYSVVPKVLPSFTTRKNVGGEVYGLCKENSKCTSKLLEDVVKNNEYEAPREDVEVSIRDEIE